MAYTPKYLLPAQISDESGGKQFDASGNPLTSSAGAIGIAQVMPATGPQAAQLAGVPWDENKYKTNRDYNLQIGDAYQGHLNQIFNGHQLAATAAYNAGPNRILQLRQKYGDSWASYLPTETKQYVKKVLGVNVDGNSTQPTGDSSNIQSIANALGLHLGDYKVAPPTAGEQADVNLGGNLGGPKLPDPSTITAKANAASTASDRYTTFLDGITQPLIQNMAAQTAGLQRIAAVKTGLANDFKTREGNLESQMQPLMDARSQLYAQMTHISQMPLLQQRLAATFNPTKYDPRVLRGKLAAIEEQMKGLDSNYSELNSLRSSVAAASVEATNADNSVLESGRQSSIAEASLLGQVAGATREQTTAAMLPFQAAAETMSLQEHIHASTLGKLSLEETHDLFGKAQASPTGTVEVGGQTFTVGELQKADQSNQSQDLSLRSMVNAYRTGDLMTADKMEDDGISKMTPEQLSQALANNGMYNGIKLSLPKLVAAQSAAIQGRDQQVQGVLQSTAMGQAHEFLVGQGGLRDQLQFTRGRLGEMFGGMPGDWSQYEQGVTQSVTAWDNGLKAAKLKGPDVANAYIATTFPQLQALRTQKEAVVDSLAKKWSGGNTALYDVANAYMRGDPLNGDAAIKGLIAVARSGMPAGAKLSGPAAQAVEAARSIVREYDAPKAGDSLQDMMQGNKSQADKDRELMNRVRSSVGAIYANSLTDSLMQSFPALARQTRDPQNQGKPIPFAQVDPSDFKAAIAHGDNAGYSSIAHQMGTDAQTARGIFQKGVDSPAWKELAAKKGWNNDQFTTFLGNLQVTQMSSTLAALDASHSARPGFSPAKAYVDFLQNPDVQSHLDQVVGGYGRSSFGAFLVSGASGGSYRDNWTAYTRAVSQQYFLDNGRQLQSRIDQQRSIGGDPFTRFNAVNQASGLTKQESQLLMDNVRPLVNMPQTVGGPGLDLSEEGALASARSTAMSQFDAVANIVRNHQFEDPQVERIRKKVATQWEVSDALVGKVFDSVSK